MHRKLIVVALLLLLAACGAATSGDDNRPTESITANATSESPTPGDASQPTAAVAGAPRLNEPFAVAIGESATVQSEGLKVSFVEVPYDQRCGSCTASGNAEVVLRLTLAGKDEQEIRLHAFPVAQNYAEALPYVVQMVDLQPRRLYPPDDVDASQYAVSLRITKPTITCQPQSDDADGYLLKLCRYVQLRQLNVAPADPTQYRIKRVEERQLNGKPVVWVFLNCCGMGDIGVIDKGSGEVVDFYKGDH
ncbi:MAG TPA: hypothetical protein VFX76_06845 [Roseiflexaceae bacterium]|nr:hypothetical protein [Roseiflexaceae bacterium]